MIAQAFPQSGKSEKDAVVKRVFQSLRIAVNQELLNLQKFLEDCPIKYLDTLKNRKELSGSATYSSMMMFITFHSLEERLVSQALA